MTERAPSCETPRRRRRARAEVLIGRLLWAGLFGVVVWLGS